LGCLLAPTLGLQLRLTFTAGGERTLSEWMKDNALVSWQVHPEPWMAESDMIAAVSLPLNLDQNAVHAFHTVLSGLRRDSRTAARSMPIVTS
jgi:hypothetical protein